MKDITHYFADPLKSPETNSTLPKEVNDVNLSEKSTKSNTTAKKRGRKKKKSTSPDAEHSKRSKCELDIEVIKPPVKQVKDNVQETPDAAEAAASPERQDNQEKTSFEGRKNSTSKENGNNHSSGSLNSRKINDIVEVQQNGQETNDDSDSCIIDERKRINNVNDGIPNVENDKNLLVVQNSTVVVESEASIDKEKKKKRKENLKALADKKGFTKRKQLEDKESEEMEKTLQSRKNVFTNVPMRDENQPEIVPKPPAYSLLNYFSKSTPEQRLKEEAAKCKISVKADVHSPKDDNSSSTPPNCTPTSRPKNSQKKKRKAEIKKALSQIDEIQFIRSESISPPPVLQEKKKSNKPKWRIQFHSDNFSDNGNDSETSSLKGKSANGISEQKTQENKVLKAIENATKTENSDTENTPTRRSLRCMARKKAKETHDIDESSETNKVSDDKIKTIDSKINNDNNESLDGDIIIIKEIDTKRTAPEKIAPLFIKKRKLDPAVIEARRMFLQSDMNENENRPTKRKQSPVRNPVLPFPLITHITQLDSENNSDNSQEISEIKLKMKATSDHLLSLDVSKFTNMTKIHNLHVERSLTTFDTTKLDIEETLSEIETRCNDARIMWNNISMIGKGENPKKLPKVRASKRRSSGKKIVNEEEKIVDNVWIHKYKPRTTEEIVGNEQSAAKLKSWLEKWKLPSRRNDNSDDDFYSSDCSSTCSVSENNQVAILMGPFGSGKTASVYAVAEELGYSVLEINASSRRAGKKILKELEEATKSHRIKKSDMKQSFLKSKVEEKKIPQNSLILMEDVNIIFEEDEGFISAAYHLASNTKRPIVMTCSDKCSHLNKLAPQQIQIKFDAITGHRASALLELISLAETGRKLALSCVETLLSCGDLRKALLQLQYLLATGDSHILPPIVDNSNRNGMSLWQKVPQCIYKSVIKEGKRKKRISREAINDADILAQIADDLENVSLISQLIQLDNVSLNHSNVKSVMNLSLTEDMRSYSHTDSVSSNIADWLTREIIHKKEDTDQNSTKILSSLLKRRKGNNAVNSILSTITTINDKKILSQDYLPCIRTICRAEEVRNSSNNKRGNRFFHYLNGTKLPSNSTNIMSACCKYFQEKSET